MTTHSTVAPESSIPDTRKASIDSRSEASESRAPEPTARLRRMVDTGKTRVTEWKGGIQDRISDRPFQSIFIAAAVGAVIGLIVGRRSR